MAHPSCWIPPSLAPLCWVGRQQRLPAQKSTRCSSSRNNCSSKNNRHWQLHHRYWCLFVIWILIINLIYCPRLLNFEAGVGAQTFFLYWSVCVWQWRDVLRYLTSAPIVSLPVVSVVAIVTLRATVASWINIYSDGSSKEPELPLYLPLKQWRLSDSSRVCSHVSGSVQLYM